MRLTDLPLDRPVATVMLLLCLTVLGTVSIFYLPLGFMPIVREPEIDVHVPFPGSHPLEGLREVVRPIEEEIATIPDVKTIWAWCSSDEAGVEVQFDWDVDPEIKLVEVRDAVERARPQLPAGIGHIRVEGDTDGPGASVLHGRISAKRDLSESWELLDRRIRRPLERIRGVARVELYGVDPLEVRIDLDFDALKQHGIDVGDLIQRINAANFDMDLGVVRGDSLRYDVRSAARFREIDEVRDLAIGPDGLRLRDVATVAIREPLLTRGRHLNRDFAIGFDVLKEASANTVATVHKLMAKIEEIGRDPELGGINLVVWFNQGEEILNSLRGLRNAGMFGGLLAICVLYFFLRRLGTTLIVAVAIPFSLLVTCGVMFVLDMEFNVLTMLGLMLGVGMLVDNAVVVIENIYRLQSKGMEADRAARLGARQVALAVLAATATTLIVWSWLFISEPDEMRIYIGAVALVICIAVVCSLLISLTFIPLASARFVSRKPIRTGFFIRSLLPRYRALLGWTLRHRFVTLALLGLLAGSAGIPIALIEKSGEPKVQQREVLIFYEVADASTVEVLEGHVNTVEDWLEANRDELEIEDIYSWFSEGNNTAQTRVYLPRGRNTERAFKQLEDKLQEGLPEIAGVKLNIGDHRGRHRGPRQGGIVRVGVHGEDPEFLEEIALDVEARLRGIEHVEEVWGPSLIGREEVRVLIDPERARALDVEPMRIAETVGFAFRGQRLRRFHGERGEVEVIVGLPETARPGLAALKDLPVAREDGQFVSLGAVADVEMARTRGWLNRVDRKTTSWVTLQFDDEETTTQAMRDEVERRLDGMDLPTGYEWDWGEGERRDDEALGVMLRGILISICVVLLLMAALFESFSQPLAILITLPLALFGAFWTLWLAGFVFEVLGFIGVIILVGVVVNNGIVMVDHVNSLRREGRERIDALLEGCGDRLRPVLMTVITTVVGLTPLAVSEFTVAGVYIQSMAVAMIGGLISSTIFTLIALPVWYTAVEDLFALIAGLFPRGILDRFARRSRAILAE
jgi:HAE1 family hydrophobic/amphiphilic exporter-1